MSVSLLHDLRVQVGAVLQVDIGQRPAVAVLPRLVILQPHALALDHAPSEGGGFLAKILHGAARIDRLRRIDSYEAHSLSALQDDRVAVHHAGNGAPLALGRLGLRWLAAPQSFQGFGFRREGLSGQYPSVTVIASLLAVMVTAQGVEAAAVPYEIEGKEGGD